MSGERRRFFRIKDRIILTYRPVDREVVETADQRAEQGQYHAVNMAHALLGFEKQLERIIRRVKDQMPELGEGLEVMNGKMNLLVRAVTAREEDLLEQHAADVDLSASGLQFHSTTPFTLQDHLQMELTLFPSYAIVRAYGRVVNCRPEADGDGYHVAVEFVALPEESRDLIVEHMFRKQSDELRERREARDLYD